VPAVRAALAAIARERLAAGDRPLARRIANTLRGTPRRRPTAPPALVTPSRRR